MLTTLHTDLRKTMAGLSRKDWFPQVPISLWVALLGLLHLIPVIDQAIGLHLHLRTPGSVRQDLVDINLSGISQLSISMFLLVMSVGLWFRSRTAWLLSMLAAVIATANLYLLSEDRKPVSAVGDDGRRLVVWFRYRVAWVDAGKLSVFRPQQYAARHLDSAVRGSDAIRVYGAWHLPSGRSVFTKHRYPAGGGLFVGGHHVDGWFRRFYANHAGDSAFYSIHHRTQHHRIFDRCRRHADTGHDSQI
jgi:hypothetical protein